jgi:hypothetical protein
MVAGPVLICVAVLFTLNAFAFRGLLSSQHPDVLPFWLPTWCYLGKSLGAGHIPLWNPAVMGGIPFAADPQSGWLYVLPMLLFTAFPCHVAISWFIVLQPVLAGLGMYWFLTSEKLSRPAATVGGLALSLPVAGSIYLLSLPFSGMCAWTALLLAAASRLLRSSTWPRRLMWLILSALAWGQLASAHLSHGLVVGTAALLTYGTARLITDVRSGATRGREALAFGSLVLLAFPLVNMAILLPRLAYLPGTTLGVGYVRLDAVAKQFGTYIVDKVLTAGIAPTFPLKLAPTRGTYLGAVVLGLAIAGLWHRRQRSLAIAFALFAAISYVLSLDAVAHALGPVAGTSTIGSFYTHFPNRLILGLYVALPILGALGLDAWREASSNRDRLLMLAPGIVVWGILPLAFGVPRANFVVPLVGAGAAAAGLAMVTRRPALLPLIPLALAVELAVSGLGIERPTFPATLYVDPGPIARYLEHHRGDGRYLSLGPRVWEPSGYHVLQQRPDWGLMATQRSMIFGLEEGQGYNPAQLPRYWTFTRAIDPKPMRYNAAGFIHADPLVLDLLQVAYLIQPHSDPPAVSGQVPVATEGTWVLYRLPQPSRRASVLTSWAIVSSPSEALGAVSSPGFDPQRQVVLESDPHPGIAPQAGSEGAATFQWKGEQSAQVVIDAPSPAVVLIRNAYATGWRATVDGRPSRVLPADDLLQGVPVPAGHHVIHLSYVEPTIGYGLAGSAVTLVGLLVAAWMLQRRQRRNRPLRTPNGAGAAQSQE